MFSSIFYVDLICADAETTNYDQILCFSQNPSGELRLGAYSYDMNVPVVASQPSIVSNMDQKALPHRIFSISSSSDRADFKKVTW